MLKLGLPRAGIRLFSTFNPIRREESSLGYLLKNYSDNDGQIQQQSNLSSKKIPADIQTLKYILDCQFSKNNTILTLSKVLIDNNFEIRNPDMSYNEKVLYYLRLPQQVIFSKGTGVMGFKKAARGEYEASYQLSTYLFKHMREKGYLNIPGQNDLEVRVKYFGTGRRAFFDCIRSKEGSAIRDNIVKFSDYTPVKYGGARSPKVRRI